MIIHPRHFVRFIDGRAGNHVVIAFLPGHLGGYLRTLQTDVTLRRDYALKLVKHKIDYHTFGEIQNTIDSGYCLRVDESRMAFLYVKDPLKPEVYFLLLKTDRTRSELWLVTFHRIRKAQFDRRLKAGMLIREHLDEFME